MYVPEHFLINAYMNSDLYTLTLVQGTKVMNTRYTLTTISDLLSNFFGLFGGIYFAFYFVLTYYQDFLTDKVLLRRLYFEQDQGDDDGKYPKEMYSKQLAGRKGFSVNFWPWLAKRLFFDYLCCYFNRCCSRR